MFYSLETRQQNKKNALTSVLLCKSQWEHKHPALVTLHINHQQPKQSRLRPYTTFLFGFGEVATLKSSLHETLCPPPYKI